jgi:hypothetical protein
MALVGDHLLSGARSGRLAWVVGRRETVAVQGFGGELPGCRPDSHVLEPDIYVDHRMISACIRFDSNRDVPYSPSRYPHGTVTKSLPRLSRIQKHRSEFAVRGSGRASPFLSPPRQGLLEALPQRLPRIDGIPGSQY